MTTLAEAAEDQDRQHLADLWRAAFSSRPHTGTAGEVMCDWIRTAARDPLGEQHLADLLRRLAVTATERDRLSYLLRGLSRTAGRGPEPDRPLAEACLRLLTAADLPDPEAGTRY
ncbi:hypothetical protein GXW82_37385 [Streptacidiphilus sp. 4-A2]|nr:hypothetical protein [Streptacidiphilus sp. 4-A2]